MNKCTISVHVFQDIHPSMGDSMDIMGDIAAITQLNKVMKSVKSVVSVMESSRSYYSMLARLSSLGMDPTPYLKPTATQPEASEEPEEDDFDAIKQIDEVMEKVISMQKTMRPTKTHSHDTTDFGGDFGGGLGDLGALAQINKVMVSVQSVVSVMESSKSYYSRLSYLSAMGITTLPPDMIQPTQTFHEPPSPEPITVPYESDDDGLSELENIEKMGEELENVMMENSFIHEKVSIEEARELASEQMAAVVSI